MGHVSYFQPIQRVPAVEIRILTKRCKTGSFSKLQVIGSNPFARFQGLVLQK